ncbi:MAG: hypothetical protein FJ288_00715 [Planctomycetes bacterium]|nr:hypothetical protein [Planctomycetota bacterium]
MTDEERIRLWVETWRRAAPELERIRAAELRAWQYDPVIVDALFEIGCLFALPRTTSGLVEQQRLFRKLAAQDA